MSHVFGTDGVRGRANQHPMTPAFVQRIGMAVGAEFTRGNHRHHVVIGKDTRLSGYMTETAITSGFLSQGMNVLLVGPLPTAAISMLVRSMRCDVGVMLSASHNSWEDNGIKLFSSDGLKLSRTLEEAIEKRLKDGSGLIPLLDSMQVGRARRLEDASGRYIERVKRSFSPEFRLDGLKVVIDCANGASYEVAPRVLWELGADVISLGISPDGTNINLDCGSTSPEAMAAKVVETKAHFGFALDGDSDRCVIADERGRIINGDRLLALIVQEQIKRGTLTGGKIVGTPLTSLSLERHLEGLGIGLLRAPVGDRNVSEAMRENGCNVGGEPSGHIILRDHGEYGDGLVSALQVLSALISTGKKVSGIIPDYEKIPQVQQDILITNEGDEDSRRRILDSASVQDAIERERRRLGERGRLIVRASGTEAKIRMLAESPDASAAARAIAGVAAALEAA